jgi:hypothetical protein
MLTSRRRGRDRKEMQGESWDKYRELIAQDLR